MSISLSLTLTIARSLGPFYMAKYIAIEFPWICSYVIHLNILEIHKLFVVVKIASVPANSQHVNSEQIGRRRTIAKVGPFEWNGNATK